MENFTKRQAVGFLGSAILFIGVFAPLVSIPVMGSINYLANGKGDGLIVLGLAVMALIAVFLKKYELVTISGIASFCVMAYTYINIQNGLSLASKRMEESLAGNPFAGLATTALQSIHIQWGWALLIVGSLLLILTGITNDECKISITAKPSLGWKIPSSFSWIIWPVLVGVLVFAGYFGIVSPFGETTSEKSSEIVSTLTVAESHTQLKSMSDKFTAEIVTLNKNKVESEAFRVEAPKIVEEMKAIKAKTEGLKVSPLYTQAHTELDKAMDLNIKAYEFFLTALEKSDNPDMTAGLELLKQSGEEISKFTKTMVSLQ